MTEFLDLDDLLVIASDAIGSPPLVRDYGLLEAALARPAATAFGSDAYPTIHTKAVALVHSLAVNQALVDGNKRLALLATYAFLDLNGHELNTTQDAAYGLLRAVAAGDSVIDPAVVDLLVSASGRKRSSPLAALTPREREVLAEIAQGKSNAGVAAALFLSERGRGEAHQRALRQARPDVGVGRPPEATAAAVQPGVVLMDINLPGISGIEATRKILDRAPDTTVILLSTYAADDLPADAVTCGAAEYVRKDDLTPAVLRDLLPA